MKRTTLSAAVLAGALALGACGSATTNGAATNKAEQTVTTAKVGDEVALADLTTASMEAVKAKRTAHMTMAMGSQGTVESDIDYGADGKTPSMAMTMTAEGQSFQMVYVDKVMYMGGEMFAQMAGGKKWIKISADGTDQMSKMMGPMLSQMESSMSNPVQSLAGVQGLKAKVTKVEGDSTTYAVTLTKAQLTELAKKQSGLPGADEQSLSSVPATVTYDMTLGKDGLPQKMDMKLGAESMTMTYSKWGQPVKIAAPPASEVGTFSMPK